MIVGRKPFTLGGMKRLADRIRELLADRGMTQKDLADQMAPTPRGGQLNRVNVTKWLLDMEPIPPDRLAECARILSVPLWDLVRLIEPGRIGVYAVAYSRNEALHELVVAELRRLAETEAAAAATPPAPQAGAGVPRPGRTKRR